MTTKKHARRARSAAEPMLPASTAGWTIRRPGTRVIYVDFGASLDQLPSARAEALRTAIGAARYDSLRPSDRRMSFCTRRTYVAQQHLDAVAEAGFEARVEVLTDFDVMSPGLGIICEDSPTLHAFVRDLQRLGVPFEDES